MSWPKVKLCELVEINIGRTPSRSNDEYWGEGYPWLSIADMSQGSSLTNTKEQITSLAVKETRPNLAPKGTVLFSFKLSIGKVGIANVDMYHNEAIASFPIKDTGKICKEYLIYALQNLDYLASTDRAVMGATLNKKKLADLQIPLPPLAVQKQIAAVLEKADTLRTQCQQMEQELNSLAQSVFLDMFGDPVTNPKGWKKASLKSITKKFNDGPFGSNLKTSHYTQSGIQVIRLTNIGVGEFKNSDKMFISEEHANTLERFKCKPGEIVIATLGEPNLRACIIPEEVPLAVNKADCIHCIPNDAVVGTEYLTAFLNLPFTLQSIQNLLHGQTRTRISSGQLAKVEILLPPLAKQEEFISFVNKRNTELVRIKTMRAEYNDHFNSLMQRAFKGELDLKDVA